MKPIFSIISVILIGAGLYLKFLYDVPDVEETTNFFVSGFLIIIGIAGLLISVFWSHPPSTPQSHD